MPAPLVGTVDSGLPARRMAVVIAHAVPEATWEFRVRVGAERCEKRSDGGRAEVAQGADRRESKPTGTSTIERHRGEPVERLHTTLGPQAHLQDTHGRRGHGPVERAPVDEKMDVFQVRDIVNDLVDRIARDDGSIDNDQPPPVNEVVNLKERTQSIHSALDSMDISGRGTIGGLALSAST